MKKILSKILLIVMVITSLGYTESFANENKISEGLKDKINKNNVVDVLIDVKDLKKINTVVNSDDNKEKEISNREKYITEIEDNAKISQKEIIDFIEDNIKKGNIESYNSFYITNTINVVGKSETIEEISKLPNVSYIEENDTVKLNTEENLYEDSELASSYRWNFSNTKVNEVYSNYNIKGSGVVIGFLDSGVDYTHKELNGNWRGNTEGVEYSWYDVFGKSAYPEDGENSGHGTATAGVAVGKTVGVAPEATWIAARAFQGIRTKNSDILKAAEWFLAPGGRADMTPDIINNSWGENTNSRWFDQMLSSWIKAGIIPVFASGNSKTVVRPGSIEYPASSLDVISVGAVDEGNKIGYFSKIGPSSLDSSKGIIKPEVVAPGVSVYTCEPGNIYSNWTGTSIAAPNVAGIIALIKEANPNLKTNDIKNILTLTASPLTDNSNKNSPNMTYGYGIVNAKKAVDLAMDYSNFTNIKRIYGSNRNKTAGEIAKTFYEKSDIVYITNGNVYADGLSMGSLTKTDNGPLLLADRDIISADLASNLRQMSPSKIIIIGGTNAISKKVESQLGGYANTVQRISGSSRVDTSIAIAKNTRKDNPSNEVFLVNGYEEADAINIVSVSSRDGIPVLFSNKNNLPTQTKSYLKDEKISKVTVIGGKNTVSSNVESELRGIGIEVSRISGANRYATGIEINKIYHGDSNMVFFANGINIADALSIGPVAGKLFAEIQIIPTNTLPSDVSSYFSTKSISEYYLLGGNNSISYINAFNIYNLFK